MADPRGFLEVQRVPMPERDPDERVKDSREIFGVLPEPELREQARRCMDCGIPFCNNGCPLGNLIPDWNDLVRRGEWREAIDQLHATNNFPEFTGLVCPAPCESACVLDITGDPVMIKQIEYSIIERAFAEGWVVPQPPEARTRYRVAVIGSGPSGLAAAAELNAVGHNVTVYERDEGPGGLMRFGVPDAKMEKWIIDRRVKVLEEEGIEFRYGVEVGRDVDADELAADHDAVVVCIGSRVERELGIPGSDLGGVHFAMDYLYQRNRAVAREEGREAPEPEHAISGAGKHVVVIGGGDTGMDCLSSANREGADQRPDAGRLPPAARLRPLRGGAVARGAAADLHHLRPGRGRRAPLRHPDHRDRGPRTATSSACTAAAWRASPRATCAPCPGPSSWRRPTWCWWPSASPTPSTTACWPTWAWTWTRAGNVSAPLFATSRDRVFAAGDARMGQSLIVNAIADGRRAARIIDRRLREPEPVAEPAAA